MSRASITMPTNSVMNHQANLIARRRRATCSRKQNLLPWGARPAQHHGSSRCSRRCSAHGGGMRARPTASRLTCSGTRSRRRPTSWTTRRSRSCWSCCGSSAVPRAASARWTRTRAPPSPPTSTWARRCPSRRARAPRARTGSWCRPPTARSARCRSASTSPSTSSPSAAPPRSRSATPSPWGGSSASARTSSTPRRTRPSSGSSPPRSSSRRRAASARAASSTSTRSSSTSSCSCRGRPSRRTSTAPTSGAPRASTCRRHERPDQTAAPGTLLLAPPPTVYSTLPYFRTPTVRAPPRAAVAARRDGLLGAVQRSLRRPGASTPLPSRCFLTSL